MKKVKFLGFKTMVTTIVGLGLIGCGGGSSSTTILPTNQTTTKEAQLIDSAIQGVDYTTNSLSGTTDESGTFQYNPTDTTITFRVGSLTLADFNLSKLNSDNKLLPADIFGVSRENTTDANLLKFIRVVQSLDTDNNPNNGILIDDNTKGFLATDINIKDANISQLKTIMISANKTLKLERASREHYKSTLSSIGVSPQFAPFVTVWETNSTDSNITIPTNSNYTYNYIVDWSDGNIENNITGDITHTYSTDGNHTVKISGEFPHLYMIQRNEDDILSATTEERNNAKQLQLVLSWGDIIWKNFKSSFALCQNIQFNSNNTPNLKDVTSMNSMFTYAINFNSNINDWDVRNITDMAYLCYGAKSFNQPLNRWDVSNVTSMIEMFDEAKNFNQPLNNWNISNVKYTSYMFLNADNFNQPLNDWNTSSIISFQGMFYYAKTFNQPLSKWDISNAQYIGQMFSHAENFNQDISSWNTSNVTAMQSIFEATNEFNQDISDWNTSNVIHMSYMFNGAKKFNKPLNKWDVSKVQRMRQMFSHAESFNQDISNWNTSNVTDMEFMFIDASAFANQDLSGWDVSKVTKHDFFMTRAGSGNTEPNW